MGKYDDLKKTLEKSRLELDEKVKMVRTGSDSDSNPFETAFYDRLEQREQRVFEWALRQDRSEIARLFANRWALNKISMRLDLFRAREAAILGEMILRMFKKQAKGAEVKLSRDPKQVAKGEILKLWLDWKKGRAVHKSEAAFHRYAVEKHPIILDTKTVARWCRTWRSDIKQ